jgi:hypothetical protein
MDRYRIDGLIVFFLLLISAASLSAQSAIRVGVVEFEEKNDIGLQNAGIIVAEWVVTEFQQIGDYEVQERLFLEEVLEEQNLMLSGVIDEEQAPEIGKIYGVDAILTGSIMRVGDEISITGRIVNVTTGSIMKTASVTTDSVSKLETEVTVLANALSDISRDEWEIKEDLEKRASPRLEIGGGVSYAFDNLDYGGLGLSVSIRFSNKWLLAWIDGTPVGGIKGLEFGAMFNVIPFLGIGASWGMVFDDLLDYAESHYLTFGVVGRPRYNMELGIMLGFATGGTIWTDNNNGGEISGIDPYFSFPGNYQVWFGWRVVDNLMLQAKYVGTSLGNLESQLPAGYQYPSSDYEFLTGRFSIMALYSNAISGNR